MTVAIKSVSNEKPKIALVVASVLMVKFFLEPHLAELNKKYEVTLFLNRDRPDVYEQLSIPVEIITIDIQRRVSLYRDIVALVQLVWHISRGKFHLVHTLNPKAGLLGIVAAWICRSPIRIHTFQGEIWANKKGLWRWLLRMLDKLVAYLATDILVVSASEREFLISEKIISRGASSVLANGSIGGVDIEKFSPDNSVRKAERELRGYSEEQLVFLYLGRMNKDKGIGDLLLAFEALEKLKPNARLLLVGPDDGALAESLLFINDSCLDKVRYEPYTNTPENVIRSADVLVLPSYREGFGVVIIEAAAAGLTAIGSRIYGISDALIDGQTGLMSEVGNPADLARVMMRLIDDSQLRHELAVNARVRVIKNFRSDVVIEAFIKHYELLLSKSNFSIK